MMHQRQTSQGDGSESGVRKILDFDAAMARLDNDRSLYNEMARYFLDDAPELVNEIHRATANGEDEAAARAAHSLKNLAATCGGDQAALAAGRVEELAYSQNREALPDATRALGATVTTLAGRLRPLVWEA